MRVGSAYGVFPFTELATLLVLRSLFGLGLAADPRGLRSVNCPENITLPGDPLLTFSSSPEFGCTDAAIVVGPRIRTMTASLAVFFPFDVFPVLGSHSSWGYQPQVRALAAFLTPSGPFSARYLPALFHAGPARGVLTLQGRSPLAEPCDLSAAAALLGLTVVIVPSRPPGPLREPGGSRFRPGRLSRRRRAHGSPSSGLCSLRASLSRG